MGSFVTTAGAVGLVKSLVDVVKYVRAKNVNGYVTQVAVWVAGILVTLLLSASDFADTIDVGGHTLGHAAIATVILAGLGLGSSAMLLNDFKQAIDRTDSAVKPALVGPPTVPVAPPVDGMPAAA